MALEFPIDCETPADRIEYCYRANELLRKLHNVFGKWYREGLSQSAYDKLPVKIKNKYSYVPQISRKIWDDFLAVYFDPISKKITAKIIEHKHILFESTRWDINVEDI